MNRGSVTDLARRNPWETLLLVILAGTIVFNVTQSKNYLGIDNFVNLFELSIEKVIIVVMMTFVIIAGQIDLSVASVMALSAAILARLNDGQSVPFVIAIVIAIAAGSAAGLVQGLVRLPAPTAFAGRDAGRADRVARARPVLVEDRSYGGFPSWFERLGQDSLLGPFPFAVLLFLVGIVVGGVVLARTALGRRVYVVGDNADVARYSALNVARLQLGCSSPPAPSPPSPACCTAPGSDRCAATWPAASSWTSSRWCCSAASASSVAPGR